MSLELLASIAIVIIVLLTLLFQSLILVPQAERVIIERLGKFNQILHPGLHFIIPFVERKRYNLWTFLYFSQSKKYETVSRYFYRIDVRESVYEFPKQNVITKDNVMMEINALLYYQIIDVKAAVYEVSNLPEAFEKITQTTLRNVIGSLDLDESLISRDQINTKLRIILDEATDKWGVKINRVELQEVNPPRDIQIAMEKQMRAERDRRAIILEAEGLKRASILNAEGAKESQILKAQGQAESQLIAAQAEAESRLTIIEAESKSIQKIKAAHPDSDPIQYLTALKYIQSLPEMTKGSDNKLIIVPYEASGLANSLASIKKIFTEI